MEMKQTKIKTVKHIVMLILRKKTLETTAHGACCQCSRFMTL